MKREEPKAEPPEHVVELVGRLQKAPGLHQRYGGWPPVDEVMRVLKDWFDEHGVDIDYGRTDIDYG